MASEPMTEPTIAPTPTDAEAAAIVAAVHALWPRPVVDEGQPPADPAWRFSGRWWNRPTAQARPRPWRA
ncbi:MAG: hypothetical protein AAFN30_03620 [Actinomycetota bacterium]